ncbi:MAG: restriction endonuclease subunit R [Actinobacteria bacterium]|nr:restriction endonuclease subunit R [Actinomycetota bacterium]
MTALTLSAQAFNWTPDIIRAERTSEDIVVGIVADGVADTVELEPGQVFRGFPRSTDAELDSLRQRLSAAGGRVSMVGASLDDATPRGELLTLDEREAFLVPQLRAAHRLGADGVRLPFGQAGSELLRRVLPLLHELGITLYEEIQGQQTPDSPAVQAALDVFADLDDPLLRVLVDCSMFMPSLPVTYLEALRAGGVPEALLTRLETEWLSPETHGTVIDLLRSGGVPGAVHTLYMNLIVRFGRSEPSVIRPILPAVGAFHLKFWDLENPQAQVTAPLTALRAELDGFSGTLCSEWGGHEWLEGADPTDYTRRHLALAGEALL